MIIPTCLLSLSDLLRQLSEANSSVTNINVGVEEVARMMKVVQRMVKEMRQLGCSNQTEKAAREQEDAHKRETGVFWLSL
jgi:hypothetical protein